VARFRLENEMREGRYCGKERKRECRLCKEKLQSWEHVWEERRK